MMIELICSSLWVIDEIFMADAAPYGKSNARSPRPFDFLERQNAHDMWPASEGVFMSSSTGFASSGSHVSKSVSTTTRYINGHLQTVTVTTLQDRNVRSHCVKRKRGDYESFVRVGYNGY